MKDKTVRIPSNERDTAHGRCDLHALGLQYQEDLKIRAQNDVTARKDKEHLEVWRTSA